MAVTAHARDVTLDDVLKRAEDLVPRVRERASQLERIGPAGGPWSPELQAKLRRDLAYSTMLCTHAVDRLASAVGAHGMLEDTPIQRAFRDIHAVANHGANNWDLQAVPYARAVLGLPPVQGR